MTIGPGGGERVIWNGIHHKTDYAGTFGNTTLLSMACSYSASFTFLLIALDNNQLFNSYNIYTLINILLLFLGECVFVCF